MRVLWFSTNSALYKAQGTRQSEYNGGSWTSTLQEEITKQTDIILGICFCINEQPWKSEQNGVTYYPVPHHRKRFKDKILDFIKLNDVTRDEIVWGHYKEHFRRAITDFQPDLIEVFGSELYVGLATIVAKEMNIPCCLHIQGFLSPYSHICLIPGLSLHDYYLSDGLFRIFNKIQYVAYWRRSVYREQKILKAIPYILGRTTWDRQVSEILAPQAHYRYGGEILRNVFYQPSERNFTKRTVITTTISAPTYKGFDIILKTASLLKNTLHQDFTWNVYGNVNPSIAERITRIHHSDVNVHLCGVVTAESLRDALLSSTLYFHSSYIESGCISIAEAQILGIPTVAANIGGLQTTITEGKTGLLFPATDPYMAAYRVMELIQNIELNMQIGKQAKIAATKRHNKTEIVSQLIKTYTEISNCKI